MITLVDLARRIGQDVAATNHRIDNLPDPAETPPRVVQVPAGGDLDTVTAPGLYGYVGQGGSIPATANAPSAVPGTLLVSEINDSSGALDRITQLAMERGGIAYHREWRHGAWGRWYRVGGGASIPAGRESTLRGVKTVPLALTAGMDTSDSGMPERGVRIPVRFNAPITRWRLHLRNFSQFSAESRTGSVALTGVWIADHDGNGTPSSIVQVAGPDSTPADGSDWVSPWITADIGGDVDKLVMYAYTGAGASGPLAAQSVSWQTAAATDVADPGASTERRLAIPFDVWIEASTPVDTPVVAAFGDSITSGARATMNHYDSWLSQYCRRVGALPRHVSSHGDSMVNFLRAGYGKVERWENASAADAVIWAMGSNDIGPTPTLETMVSNFHAVKPSIERALGPVRYIATVTPRGAKWDTAQTALWNAWNDTIPSLATWEGVFDFSTAVSDGTGALRPEFDGGDGVHPSTAGYAAMADTITIDQIGA